MPCYPTCRYCGNSSAMGCITCIDGYYYNSTIKLCQKLTCPVGLYVDSISGCKKCSDTYPNSKDCTSNGATGCAEGYILITSSNGNICTTCGNVNGYKYDALTGKC